MRVLYFGMPVPFSTPPLRALLASPHEVAAVVVPAESSAARVESAAPADLGPDAFILHPSTFSLLASGLQTIAVKSLKDKDTLRALAALRPDVICVACFPHIFPPALLDLPQHGCLNLHPSLLPRYLGPAPLFWQFQRGEARTGVTLHFMDEGADSGDIVSQRRIPFADGLSGEAADALCAEAGAELLIEALDLLAADACPRLPQESWGVEPSFAPWPAAADFTISTDWSARRAFNFVRGTAHWDRSYDVIVDGDQHWAYGARSFSPGDQLGQSWRAAGEGVAAVQFADGVVRFDRWDMIII